VASNHEPLTNVMIGEKNMRRENGYFTFEMSKDMISVLEIAINGREAATMRTLELCEFSNAEKDEENILHVIRAGKTLAQCNSDRHVVAKLNSIVKRYIY
jgi:hypothetical protein